jgi:hypothetical protein
MSWSLSELFTNIAEIIVNTVSAENERKILYRGIIAEFESFDCDSLHGCYDIDHVLDSILDEFYEDDEIKFDDNEDEWPDGGREDF